MAILQLTGVDVGAPLQAGRSTPTDSGYDIVAGGRDIWEQEDQFHFAQIQHTGDFDLATRIESMTMPHLYTKTGIMVRESLAADSAHVFFFVFGSNDERNHNNGGYEFQARSKSGGDCAAVYPENYTVTPPLFPVHFPTSWLRLKRVGNVFEAYFSEDGTDWTLYTRQESALPSTVYVGLAATSHEEDQTVEVKFRDISFA